MLRWPDSSARGQVNETMLKRDQIHKSVGSYVVAKASFLATKGSEK